MDKNEKLVDQIFKQLGGKENIISAENCMTRLRFTLKDPSLAKPDEIKALDDVLGVVENPLQVIVGPGKAKKVMDILKSQLGEAFSEEGQQDATLNTLDWQENKSKVKNQQKESAGKKIIRAISNIFIPLIPAIIAAGLFNGISGLIINLQKIGTISPDNAIWAGVATVLSLMGGAFMSYFAIYVGINSAKVFGATPALGGMVGAMTIMTQITTLAQMLHLYNQEVPAQSILQTGRGGIIAVIVGVYLLACIEKFVRKHIPDVLDLIVTPMVSILLTTVLLVGIIMPVTGYVSDGIMFVLNLLIGSTNPFVAAISGYILAALFLPLVLVGMHQALTPIYALQLEQLGVITLFPVLAMAGAGQVGSSIAIYMKAKKAGKHDITRTVAGALPAGFLGVGEPLLYGVTLPLGKPFLTGGLGAGFGGAYIMLTHVTSVAFGASGLPGILLMSPDCMLNYFIGWLIALVAGFILSGVFVKESDFEKF